MSVPFPAILEAVASRNIQDIENENETTPIDNLVQNQVAQLGQDPSLIEVATVLLKQSARAEQEARQARMKQETELNRSCKSREGKSSKQ